ncbi:MAG: LytR C-terminal domain-containing protein [Gemmatimonadota bacterium]|nr:LytR C-terminal domain-containing protein [Gemmatimonadota bacterium]MDE3217346.1 LytR C-terminal domain-containing protein [Gemmatimonadota bacterium]
MKARGIAAIAVAALVVAGGFWYWRHRAREAPPPAARTPDVTAPADERVRVEVLNATATRGLARAATFVLRRAGFDVVLIGTAGRQQDSTVVLDRSGHPEWAARVARALGGARVETRPDSTFYVDVTVLLGRTWRSPPEPLRP